MSKCAPSFFVVGSLAGATWESPNMKRNSRNSPARTKRGQAVALVDLDQAERSCWMVKAVADLLTCCASDDLHPSTLPYIGQYLSAETAKIHETFQKLTAQERPRRNYRPMTG